MIKTVLILFFLGFSMIGFAQSSSKKKTIVMEKADLDDVKGVDEQMKNDMNRFLGFGVHVALKDADKVVSKTGKNNTTKSDFILQMGFQLPEFIRTNPPDKVFKVGWTIGFNK